MCLIYIMQVISQSSHQIPKTTISCRCCYFFYRSRYSKRLANLSKPTRQGAVIQNRSRSLLTHVGRPRSRSISEETPTTQIVRWVDADHIVTAEARPKPTWSDLSAPWVGGRAVSLLLLSEEHLWKSQFLLSGWNPVIMRSWQIDTGWMERLPFHTWSGLHLGGQYSYLLSQNMVDKIIRENLLGWKIVALFASKTVKEEISPLPSVPVAFSGNFHWPQLVKAAPALKWKYEAKVRPGSRSLIAFSKVLQAVKREPAWKQGSDNTEMGLQLWVPALGLVTKMPAPPPSCPTSCAIEGGAWKQAHCLGGGKPSYRHQAISI